MKMSRRMLLLVAGVALVAAALPASSIAATKSTAYFSVGTGSSIAYLIDWLPKNGTGERVQKDLDLGTESRVPIDSWGFDGLNLVQTRAFGGGERHRTWVPLRNQGTKFRWVMESELIVPNVGEPFTLIKPRVNYYEDTGKAVPPAQASQAKGMVYLNSKPRLAR